MCFTRRQFLKATSSLSSLLLLQACSIANPSHDPQPVCNTALLKKMRPRQIQVLSPAENIVIQPLKSRVPINQGYFLEVELGAQTQELEFPAGARLLFDGKDVTSESTVGSGCFEPVSILESTSKLVCGHILYQILGPLHSGRHAAQVCFKDKKGEDFCYDWIFYADPGDGSGLRDLCPEDRVVPRQMGILFPAHNQVYFANEEIPLDVHFVATEIIYPNSVRLFVDNQELPINWGPPPLRGIASFYQRIPAGELAIGKHVVKIEFQDKSGQVISYDWNFYIVQLPD